MAQPAPATQPNTEQLATDVLATIERERERAALDRVAPMIAIAGAGQKLHNVGVMMLKVRDPQIVRSVKGDTHSRLRDLQGAADLIVSVMRKLDYAVPLKTTRQPNVIVLVHGDPVGNSGHAEQLLRRVPGGCEKFYHIV